MVQWLQWLGPGAFTAMAWVQSLVKGVRSHKPHGVAKNKTKTTMRYDFIPIRMSIIKKSENNKWECGKIHSLLGKMMQLLRKMLWRSLKKLKIELAYDPAIPLLGIYPKELKARTQTDICPPFFFFYGCTGSLLLRGLSLVAASRGYSSLRCAGSRHAGFSICGTWAQ